MGSGVTIMESELLREYKLTEEDLEEPISDPHLEEISRTSSKEWRSLPPHLELPDTTVGDIERDSQKEDERRNSFFFTWKHKKGTCATYRKLVRALLKIDCRGDAEKVCKLLLESVSTRQKNSSPPVKRKPTQPKSDEGIGGIANLHDNTYYNVCMSVNNFLVCLVVRENQQNGNHEKVRLE